MCMFCSLSFALNTLACNCLVVWCSKVNFMDLFRYNECGDLQTHIHTHSGIFGRKQKSTNVWVFVASIFDIYMDTLSVNNAPKYRQIYTRIHKNTLHWNWKRFVIWTIKWYKIGFDSSLYFRFLSLSIFIWSLFSYLFTIDSRSFAFFSFLFCFFLSFLLIAHTPNVGFDDAEPYPVLVKTYSQINWNSFSPIALWLYFFPAQNKEKIGAILFAFFCSFLLDLLCFIR